MNRRDAIIRLALLMGGSVVGSRLLQGAWSPDAAGAADAGGLALLDEIGETIIPATDVPGAKAARIGEFIAMMVRDCYEPEAQAVFQSGLRELREKFHSRYGREFVGAPAGDRTAFLNELDGELRAHRAAHRGRRSPHCFGMLKELSILGYFSSEIGCTQAIRFTEVPGSFDGNAPYRPGDRVWFS